MKDFADFDNTTGAFPDVLAQDATGSGTTDGTPYKADLTNDIWGFFQALLNDAGDTPSGDCEEDGASQLLDALKTVTVGAVESVKTLPSHLFQSKDPYSSNWGKDYNGNASAANMGQGFFPLMLETWKTIIAIVLYISTGASRTGDDRLKVELCSQNPQTGELTVIDTQYQTASSGAQSIVFGEFEPNNQLGYLLYVYAGTDSPSHLPDTVFGCAVGGTQTRAIAPE
jgi:hypothetical protein